jgi:hypothetical protein
MWDTAYSYRYFVLIKEGKSWRVTGTVRLDGLPIDQKRLRVPGGTDILVRRTVNSGVPNPNGVDAVRFAPNEVQVSRFGDDFRAFDACFPSDFDIKNIAVRDSNSDRIQDIILTVDDFSCALSNPTAQRGAQEACAKQVPFRPTSRSRDLVFTCDGVEFTASDSAVKLLQLDEGKIESTLIAWEVYKERESLKN